MNKDEFWLAVIQSEAGTMIPYHRGEHCGGHLRSFASDLFKDGIVTLVTKKHGPSDFEYFVVKLKEKKGKR